MTFHGLLGAPHEQRQNPTLETLLQAPHPRPPKLDRAGHHRQAPRLAVPIAVPLRHIRCRSPFRPAAAEQLGNLLLQQILNPVLNPTPGKFLQRAPLCALR
jgi:hypothetical protein